MSTRRPGRHQQGSFGRNLAAPAVPMAAKSWDTPIVVGGEPWRLLDGDTGTFWSTPEPARYPADFGVEFGRPIDVSGLEYLCPYNMGTGDLMPTAEQQEVQVWREGKWAVISTTAEKEPCDPPWRVTPWKHAFQPVRTSRIRVVIKDGRQPRPTCLHMLPPGTGPWVSDRPMVVRHLSVISRNLAAGPQSLIWGAASGAPRKLMVSAANDGNPDTYLPLLACEAVGYEWPAPVRLNGVVLRYNHFGFGEQEQIPGVDQQVLEYEAAGQWRAVRALKAQDWSASVKRAPLIRAGIVTTAFSFDAVTCRRLRLRFTGLRSRGALMGMEVYRSEVIREYVLGLPDEGAQPAQVRGRELDLNRNFAGVMCDETRGGQTDWLKLGQVDHHLMAVKGFDRPLTSRKGTKVESLTDGRMDTWWSPGGKLPVEIGAEWREPVLVGRVEAVYRAEQGKRHEPAYDSQRLEYWDGRQWLTASREPEVDESTLDQGYTTWTYVIFPTAAGRFRLVISKLHESCRGSDTLQMIRLAMLEDVPRAHRDWLCSARGDPYGRWLLHGGAEPTYESISAHILAPIMRAPVGFRSMETLGKVRETAESAVSWEGTVLTPWPHGLGGGFRVRARVNWYVGFAFGAQPHMLGIPHRAIQRRLIDGELPGGEFTHYHEGLIYRQTVVACEVGHEGVKGKIANFIRVEVENPGKAKQRSRITVVTGCHLAHPNRAVPVASRYERAKGRLTDASGRMLLWHSAGGVFRDELEKTVTYELTLNFGERRAIEIRQPLFPCDEADGNRLAGMTFEGARAHFRKSWQAALAMGMRIETPEDRVNHAYRASLTQLMIGDHAGITPDGLWPSHYYWATLGAEDNWNAQAFAEFGYFATAQGIYDQCLLLLNAHFRAHPADYWVGIFNTAGLIPAHAIRVGRLARNKEWLKKITPVLKDSIEWVRTARRQTLGQIGLHAGLLPKRIYGGDIAESAYGFWHNVAGWWGLRELGRLLQELGDTKTAEAYAKEAAEFKGLLLRLMRQSRLTRQRPTSISNRAYWPMPYEYSPTHFQAFLPMILETGIFPWAEAEEYTNWLVADGRTFCGVQRIWTGGVLNRETGRLEYVACVESQYNLGTQWAYLNRDRIADYLLGFYGLLAVNLDRDFFTGGESNELGVAETDRLIYSKTSGNRRDTNWMESSNPDTQPPSVWLLMLRHMLVMEEEDENGRPTGVLWLNRAAPRGWFEDGERLAVENAPVFSGKISWRVESRVGKGRIMAEVDCSQLEENRTLHLRLRHPEKKKIKRVKVNGRTSRNYNAEREIIVIKSERRLVQVEANY